MRLVDRGQAQCPAVYYFQIEMNGNRDEGRRKGSYLSRKGYVMQSKIELQSVVDALREKRAFLAERLQRIDARFRSQAAERLPSPGDAANLHTNDAVYEGIRAQDRTELASIDAALTRVEAGTYGTCVECDAKIPAGRLKALPFATLCVKCAAAQE